MHGSGEPIPNFLPFIGQKNFAAAVATLLIMKDAPRGEALLDWVVNLLRDEASSVFKLEGGVYVLSDFVEDFSDSPGEWLSSYLDWAWEQPSLNPSLRTQAKLSVLFLACAIAFPEEFRRLVDDFDRWQFGLSA
ncbi:hypothetical protein DX908_02675 [Parvularcula marina]|uniref:Uncharacterized protein n=2 Tax=Parvularcula marina TaxID=2292771 RepID=A0A371RFP5_9PROT|nr:hypothetical protein DX908_02675 [Parvularcula marina]